MGANKFDDNLLTEKPQDQSQSGAPAEKEEAAEDLHINHYEGDAIAQIIQEEQAQGRNVDDHRDILGGRLSHLGVVESAEKDKLNKSYNDIGRQLKEANEQENADMAKFEQELGNYSEEDLEEDEGDDEEAPE